MALVMVFLNAGVNADMQGLVMSIPHAISDDNIYKVIIEEIDGVPQDPALNYRLAKGAHVIRVSIMLDVEWSPKLPGASEFVKEKEIELNIESGTSYQIGARFNVDAPIESQLDGSFWEPIIYREIID
jgi:hypothetical protein